MKFNYLIALIGLALLFACEAESPVPVDKQVKDNGLQFRSEASEFIPFGIPFPEGTVFQYEDGELIFTLPNPYFAVGIDANGNYHTSAIGGSGSVTCTCTEGSGCDPVKSGGDYGCLMKHGCSSCDKENASISSVSAALSEIVILSSEFDLFVESFAKLNEKYLLPTAFIDYEPIADLLGELERNLLESSVQERKTVLINAYGYILPIEVPADVDDTSIAFLNGGSSGGETCSCNVNGDCPRKKKLIVVYCDSDNCTSCTMSGIIVNDSGVQMNLESKEGKITLSEL